MKNKFSKIKTLELVDFIVESEVSKFLNEQK
jgi:hypothetical protein